MTDIVERLRDKADENYEMLGNIHEPLLEAAAEIERLRARLEIDPSHPYDGIYARDETIRQQDKQIERLRAALKLFACDCEGEQRCFNPDNCQHYIARAALEGRDERA